ncbi:hypothetical protein Nhal_2874 [Nitrosococcus halophilus Nc 4]|uniref:Uncharacterized protein n=1 Tax=Nitrosococcus halophilus (strain Nc4) TaxID=472759 RepID=D5BY27_NITHN|nr:hypothetical protein Nhal_2874 [Nitrosococcus halophilus Nc 4]
MERELAVRDGVLFERFKMEKNIGMIPAAKYSSPFHPNQ